MRALTEGRDSGWSESVKSKKIEELQAARLGDDRSAEGPLFYEESRRNVRMQTLLDSSQQ